MKKLLVILTALFFLAMAVLTFTARSIHNAMIPNVTAKRLTREVFDGNVRRLAAPKELLDGGDVYVIVSRTVNGEKRDFAQRVTLATGAEKEGFYEVTGGMADNELVIFDSDRGLMDGDEVFVVR